jgi:NifU-like protein
MVCRCLGVTEVELLAALATNDIRSIQELRQLTGAGTGCNACIPKLRRYLERVALPLAPAAG